MAILITFAPIWSVRPEEDVDIIVLQGEKGAALIRETMEEMPEGYPDIVYDTESSKVFRRPNKLSLIQGEVKGTISWTGDDIQASDIERFKALNKNSVFTESTTSEAIANKEYVFTYKYGADYPILYNQRGKWSLAGKATMEAMIDNTWLLCTKTMTDYNNMAIDIPAGETRTITKQQTTDYLFFHHSCSVDGETIDEQFAVKKLISDSVNITNNGEVPRRVVLISK